MKKGEENVLREVALLRRELRVGAQRLLVEGEDARREQADKPEGLLFLACEGDPMGESGVGEELTTPEPRLDGRRQVLHLHHTTCASAIPPLLTQLSRQLTCGSPGGGSPRERTNHLYI